MALSKTHATVTLLALLRCSDLKKDAISIWKKHFIPYVLLPDAIRCYNFGEGIPNNRVISHFEINHFTGKPSWMRFPDSRQIKVIDETVIAGLEKHVENDYRQVAIGDTTSIETFREHNKGLDSVVYRGCEIHLMQDIVYDDFIRQVIDCDDRYDNGGKFFFDKKEYDAKSVRTLISTIEENEFYVLSQMIKDEFGIIINKEFFEEHVKNALKQSYSQKMAESTWKYITFSDNVEILNTITNEQIRNVVEEMVRATVKSF